MIYQGTLVEVISRGEEFHFNDLLLHMSRWKGNTLTFVHKRYWCTGSQGPPGLGYCLLTAAVWLLQASHQWPLLRMWCHMHHTKFTVDGTYGDTSPYTSHTGFLKVAVPSSWRVLLPLWIQENLSTPLASWVTLILPEALQGTSAVSK